MSLFYPSLSLVEKAAYEGDNLVAARAGQISLHSLRAEDGPALPAQQVYTIESANFISTVLMAALREKGHLQGELDPEEIAATMTDVLDRAEVQDAA